MGDIREVDLLLSLEDSDSQAAQIGAAARQLGISPETITDIRPRKRSIDARQKETKIQLRVEVAIGHSKLPPIATSIQYPEVSAKSDDVIIIGAGPAGLFAALRCLEKGAKPIVLERGKDASARRFDLAPILRKGTVIEESNYCFGEGGAGTFSDGKLYTRAKKRGPVADVYRTLVAHGAPESILIDARPHIGSNLLPNVVKAMRQSILNAGGEVHFESKVVDLHLQEGEIKGCRLSDGRDFFSNKIILATGHSARDIYVLLKAKGIQLEQKAFAMGVRIEHPQQQIDRRQYHLGAKEIRNEKLPAASYSLATKIENRGVHSFCMCPGGFIVPAATTNDQVVVNGMSLSRRGSPFANSGFVVTIEPEDTRPFQDDHGVLAGMAMQSALEQKAKELGGQGQVAPAQRAHDFVEGAPSQSLPDTSYFPGIKACRLDLAMPPFMVWRLQKALRDFAQKFRGYLSPEAVLLGFESRTSSRQNSQVP